MANMIAASRSATDWPRKTHRVCLSGQLVKVVVNVLVVHVQ